MTDKIIKECGKFNIHGQRFEFLKTVEIKSTHEIHSLSVCINNVKVYYNEWNIELINDVIYR